MTNRLGLTIGILLLVVVASVLFFATPTTLLTAEAEAEGFANLPDHCDTFSKPHECLMKTLECGLDPWLAKPTRKIHSSNIPQSIKDYVYQQDIPFPNELTFSELMTIITERCLKKEKETDPDKLAECVLRVIKPLGDKMMYQFMLDPDATDYLKEPVCGGYSKSSLSPGTTSTTTATTATATATPTPTTSATTTATPTPTTTTSATPTTTTTSAATPTTTSASATPTTTSASATPTTTSASATQQQENQLGRHGRIPYVDRIQNKRIEKLREVLRDTIRQLQQSGIMPPERHCRNPLN
jgi:hypothetical protein